MKFYEGAGLLTFREKISKRTSIHHQELKLAIQRQIKYLEKQINN